MKFPRLICLLFILAMMFSGCVNKSSQVSIASKPIIEDNTVIDIIEYEISDYSFVKSARYIFLDNIIPIGDIEKIEFYNDTIIIHDKITHSLLFFCPDGNFISKISHLGRGPGEYYALDDFTIAHDLKQVFILDKLSQKILQYNFESNFLSEIDLGWFRIDRISYLDNSLFLYNGPKSAYTKDELAQYHSLLKLDIKTGLIEGYFPGGQEASHIRMENRAFFVNDCQLYFIDRMSFDIHQIDSSQISNLFTVNFHTNDKLSSFIKDISLIEELIDTEFSHNIGNVCINDNYLYFDYIRNRDRMHVVYNFEEQRVVFHANNIATLSSELVLKDILFFGLPQYHHKGEFISIAQSSIIKNTYKDINFTNVPSHLEELIYKFKNIKEHDNPVLIFLQFGN